MPVAPDRQQTTAPISPECPWSKFILTELLPASPQRVSLDFVKKGFVALLVLALALYAGFGCATPQAEAAIKAPCCGPNCPVPSSAGDQTCCQVQNSSTPALVVSANASLSSFESPAGSIHACVVTPALAGIEQTSAFPESPPGAVKLALLCSRQI